MTINVAIITKDYIAIAADSLITNIKDNKDINECFPKQPAQGIGLHIVGFETIEKNQIPELFLLTNFLKISQDHYKSIGEFYLTRNVYGTIL